MSNNEQTYLWLLIIIILTVIEAGTLSITTIWFMFGSFVAFILAIFKVPLWGQFMGFVITTIISLVFTKPILTKKFKIGKAKLDSILGEEGVAIKDIDKHSTGQVRLVNNSIWTAVSKDNATIPVGTEVVVLDIKGVKLIVEKIEKTEN